MRGKRKHGTGYCDCCNKWTPISRANEKIEIQKEIDEGLEEENND